MDADERGWPGVRQSEIRSLESRIWNQSGWKLVTRAEGRASPELPTTGLLGPAPVRSRRP
jgi:hypothetical protein